MIGFGPGVMMSDQSRCPAGYDWLVGQAAHC